MLVEHAAVIGTLDRWNTAWRTWYQHYAIGRRRTKPRWRTLWPVVAAAGATCHLRNLAGDGGTCSCHLESKVSAQCLH